MLTAIIIATSFLFAAIITIDFAAGLIKLWQNAGAKTQPPIEAKPAIEQPAIANQVEPASALPDLWMQPVEEAAAAVRSQQMNNIKPIFLLPAAPEVVKQPENDMDYTQLSIRQLKRLASGRVKNYSSLTKSQLISALAAA